MKFPKNKRHSQKRVPFIMSCESDREGQGYVLLNLDTPHTVISKKIIECCVKIILTQHSDLFYDTYHKTMCNKEDQLTIMLASQRGIYKLLCVHIIRFYLVIILRSIYNSRYFLILITDNMTF